MSNSSAQSVVKQYLACLAGGDMAGVIALHTDDSIIDMPGSADLPWGGRWIGIEKIREYFQVMPAALEIRGHEQALWIVEGDKVCVTGTEVAASRVSGKEYSAKWCWVFVVRDGKIALWDAYEDTEAMFKCGPWRP